MTPAEKDAAVLDALGLSSYPPKTPRLIGALAACKCGETITQDSVLRALKRIGAIRHPGGLYSAPAEEQPAPQPKVVRGALAPFVCCVCRKRTADYRGSRARGGGRVCSGCVAP